MFAILETGGKQYRVSAGDTLQVEIQFQMDRKPFGLMHYALDQLPNTDPVFPDVTRLNPAWNERQILNIRSVL